MSWSAQELAELAGTSRRAVRHYQEFGLLDEPDRASNGYQQYKVFHLIRLLRIRRLTWLGLTLQQIADLGEDDLHASSALASLDTELTGTIERLQAIQAELQKMLHEGAPTDLPADLDAATSQLSAADRSLTIVLSRVLSPAAVNAWRDLLGPYSDSPAVKAFDRLPPEAEETVKVRVCRKLGPHIQRLESKFPDLIGIVRSEVARSSGRRPKALDKALKELYNPAQLDVLRRLTS